MSRSVPSSRQLSPIRDRNGLNGNGNKKLNNSNGYISASAHPSGYVSGHASGYASRARTPVAEFVDPAEHPALNPGCVAVITGAASGIGLAAAVQLAGMGLRIVLADVDEPKLTVAASKVGAIIGEANVITVVTDVSKLEDVKALKERAFDAFGEVSILMNNAGIGLKGTSFGELENWKRVMDVNLWGVINIQHVFAQAMVHQENPSIIITTGSKQGITNPPGNAAYNASKAAVKSVVEGLAHELYTSQAKVTAHLFVPGWTYTGLTKGNTLERPAGAWTAQQTVQYMFERVRLGDFYIIVPDNETSPQLDQLRMRWAAEDVSENRPALSRWHPEWKARYEEYIREGMEEDYRRRTTRVRGVMITEGDAGVE